MEKTTASGAGATSVGFASACCCHGQNETVVVIKQFATSATELARAVRVSSSLRKQSSFIR